MYINFGYSQPCQFSPLNVPAILSLPIGFRFQDSGFKSKVLSLKSQFSKLARNLQHTPPSKNDENSNLK